MEFYSPIDLEKSPEDDQIIRIEFRAKMDRKRQPPDLMLKVGERTFCAHRELLCSKSDYFSTMLKSSWTKESKEDEIELLDTDATLFSIVLDSFYTDSIQISPELSTIELFDLYHLYIRYLFTPPAEALLANVPTFLDRQQWDGLWPLLDVSLAAQDGNFLHVCKTWIEKNRNEWFKILGVYSSKWFRSMSIKNFSSFLGFNIEVAEEFFLMAAIKWIKHNKNHLTHSQICIVLNRVRISLVPFKSLEVLNRFIPLDLMVILKSQWKAQMSLLNSFDSKLTVINGCWEDFVKDVCYTPDHTFIAKRGFMVRGENVAHLPLSIHEVKFDEKHEDFSSLKIVVDLRLPFWLNEISLIFSKNISELLAYVLECSVDGNVWETLFDYRKYYCINSQQLIFPATVIRFLRISGRVQYRFKTKTSREIDGIESFEAFYRPEHNHYSFGTRQGLYFSPYHIHMIRFRTFSMRHPDGLVAVLILTDQPVMVNKFSFSLPKSLKVSYTLEIYDHEKDVYTMIYDRSNEVCSDLQNILFTHRPVNLVRFVVTKFIESDNHCRIDQRNDLRLKNFQFFTSTEIKQIPPCRELAWKFP